MGSKLVPFQKACRSFLVKLGQKVASEFVTAIDEERFQSLGTLNVDDEGTKTQRNVLIEKGF